MISLQFNYQRPVLFRRNSRAGNIWASIWVSLSFPARLYRYLEQYKLQVTVFALFYFALCGLVGTIFLLFYLFVGTS